MGKDKKKTGVKISMNFTYVMLFVIVLCAVLYGCNV
ncbi:hypothetical protein PEPS_00700 [Persicobacter psychrovividus]|uniref:Lipoprotein n=1 Tax=Persicobacter psychrovividus TaxID=387638 RepID=A0ABM7VA46_9BACT|nr:hypothetical protein PEPS_00700 [Persicobacter psychrovividus]